MFLLAASCVEAPVDSAKEALAGLASQRAGEAAFFVPADPPSAGYTIEASCIVDGAAVQLEGQAAIALKNTTKRSISVIALRWSESPSSSLNLTVEGAALEKHPEQPSTPSVHFFTLPEALRPNQTATIDIGYTLNLRPSSNGDIYLQAWYPKLWWDGLPTRDSFRVKLDPPSSDYQVASSGRLDPSTGYYENAGVTTNFGFWLSTTALVEERDAAGVQVRALFTEEGRECAALCLETAVDVIEFYQKYHGTFPFDSFTIIPGASRPMGGYPYASALVVIHGQQAFDQRPPLHWKWITAHEAGHQYWGEYVMSADTPADYTSSWMMIGMGIFADRAYTEARGLGDEKHQNFYDRYTSGVKEYFDTTADAPESLKAKQKYDRNNVLIHGKGYSIVSALRHTLGDEPFQRLYLRAVREYGGKRMGYRDLQRLAEEESGESLRWFFDSWVRSPRYLCYEITAQESQQEGDAYVSVVTIERLGRGDSIAMPVDIQAKFEDGTTQTAWVSRFTDTMDVRFESRSQLKEAVLDPRGRLARLDIPLAVRPAELPDRIRNLPYSSAWEEGIELYRIAVDSDVQDSRTWFKLGMVVFEGGYLDESLDCFRRLLDLHVSTDMDFMALCWMGNVWDARGNREEAIKQYRRALATGSESSSRHDQFRIESSREWIEKRLKEPYDWSTVIKK
jgi:tetratricopeptide (TPR) repeat protein